MNRPATELHGAPSFARELLTYAREADRPDLTTSFVLPGIRLDLVSDSEGYAELCRRALVDSEVYADNGGQVVRSAAFDYATRPDMPRLRIPTGDEPPLDPEDVIGGGSRAGQYDPHFRLWQFFDRSTLRAVEAFQSPGYFPPWIGSFPLRNVLNWAYVTIGWRMVHGGSLGVDGKGIMLAGSSGAGKSGTTLAGIAAGLDSVGDDYVTLDIADGKVTAYPVTRLMKQDAKGLARLGIDPAATKAGEPNWVGKYEFDFEELGGGRRVKSLELEAILIPRISHNARSKFTRAPARVGMLAFAPSNLLQLPGDWRESMAFTSEVARRLPSYFLELSDNADEIADAIGNFIVKGAP
ncbi:MAG TPA: hypothetical protein VG757_06275 [Devosia sp.]|nr:hypothetical protein [Devosia sp.]